MDAYALPRACFATGSRKSGRPLWESPRVVGLRLRLGILAFEWRQMLRSGLRNENGFTAAW